MIKYHLYSSSIDGFVPFTEIMRNKGCLCRFSIILPTFWPEVSTWRKYKQVLFSAGCSLIIGLFYGGNWCIERTMEVICQMSLLNKNDWHIQSCLPLCGLPNMLELPGRVNLCHCVGARCRYCEDLSVRRELHYHRTVRSERSPVPSCPLSFKPFA